LGQDDLNYDALTCEPLGGFPGTQVHRPFGLARVVAGAGG
jgi:hypothetical protein